MSRILGNRRVRTIAIVAGGAIVAAGIIAVLVVVTVPGTRTPPLPPSGIVATATLTPRAALFGDTVTTRVDVLLDRRKFDPSTLSVDGNFSPYAATSDPIVTRHDLGRATRVITLVRLSCLSRACLPPNPLTGGRMTIPLRGVTVSVTKRGGGTQLLQLPLPDLEVASRMSPQDVIASSGARAPPFHVSTTTPPVSYAVSPTLAFWLLLVAAVVLFAVAALLGRKYFPRFERRSAPRSPLERALALVEEARRQGLEPEQRKALERLADELRLTGSSGLATSAEVLAWSEEEPPSPETGELAGRVRATLNGGSNGAAAS